MPSSLNQQLSLGPVSSVEGSTPGISREERPVLAGGHSERLYVWRKLKSEAMQAMALVCALLVIAPLGLILFHLLQWGFTSLNWAFFTHLPKPVGETGGGMANAIVGTFLLLGLASLLGVPAGVLGGIYLAEYPSAKLTRLIQFGADVLNGVPSIIWGIVVYALMVLPMKR
jgi:phosphate transport system permease protein